MISTYIFWIFTALIFYSYIGYPLVLYTIVGIKKLLHKSYQHIPNPNLPDITIIIAAYNECELVNTKVQNTQLINYPKNKIRQIWVTDGSTDGTPDILKSYNDITVIHNTERLGKAAAINRAMEYVTSPITVFSDANTMLLSNALIELITPFQDKKVGCVSGEKQVLLTNNSSSTGEGVYWKYESVIKKLESETGSTLSAAGELFAIRTELYQPVSANTILDDFEISTQIALKGFAIKYSEKAITTEKGSVSFDEEQKRKIRIAAGGFQTLFRNPKLLNPFTNPALCFKYLSHKVTRWTITPIAILTLPYINLHMLLFNRTIFYTATFALLALFYMLGFIGYLLKNNQGKFHLFGIPYYLIMIHISQLQGFVRFVVNKQNPKWEKVKRET